MYYKFLMIRYWNSATHTNRDITCCGKCTSILHSVDDVRVYYSDVCWL